MFEVALTFLEQLCGLIIPMIALYVLFDFVGMLLFDKRQNMKKFILGYVIGSIISSMATDYLVRTEIFMKLAQRGLK